MEKAASPRLAILIENQVITVARIEKQGTTVSRSENQVTTVARIENQVTTVARIEEFPHFLMASHTLWRQLGH